MANERTKCPLTDDQIKHMVNRFLAWKLPEDFTPDAGISFKPILRDGEPWPEAWPVGTNLLMATQAEAMIRYMVDGIQHGGVCLWCGFSTTRGSLDELADAIYAHLGECHASPVPALQSAIRASEARERELQGKLDAAEAASEKDERDCLTVIDERDAREEVIGEAYQLVMDEWPEWSSDFVFKDALDAMNERLGADMRERESLKSERDAARMEVLALRERFGEYANCVNARIKAIQAHTRYEWPWAAQEILEAQLKDALQDTSATAERVKDEIEREALEKFIAIITNPENEIVWRRPERGSIHADSRFIRDALEGGQP